MVTATSYSHKRTTVCAPKQVATALAIVLRLPSAINAVHFNNSSFLVAVDIFSIVCERQLTRFAYWIFVQKSFLKNNSFRADKNDSDNRNFVVLESNSNQKKSTFLTSCRI